MEGRKRGYDQILWLFPRGDRLEVTEAGGSNFFVIWRNKKGVLELVTAPLDDKIILPGVTRRSVLDLTRERLTDGSKDLPSDLEGLTVAERTYTIDEIVEAREEGRLVESFLSGTAVSLLTLYLSDSGTDGSFSTSLHQ